MVKILYNFFREIYMLTIQQLIDLYHVHQADNSLGVYWILLLLICYSIYQLWLIIIWGFKNYDKRIKIQN